jgi:hypothetical protein
MKLSLSLFVITLALSATTTAYGAEAVTGAVDKNGVACQALDTECSKEYDVPGADGPDGDGPGDEGDFVIENRCPLYPSVGGECDGGELVNVICANKTTKTRFECVNNVFVITTDDVGQAFTDQPTATPIPGTAGPAVITGEAVIISKDAEETDVSGIDIGIDDSAASSTTIVSSIVGITAAVGVIALL